MIRLSNADALARIVSLLYETVHDDTAWPAALEALRHYFHTADACFVIEDRHGTEMDAVCVGGDPVFARRYLELGLGRTNPFTRSTGPSGLGRVFTDYDPVDPVALRLTDFYRDWMVPQDRETMLGCKLVATAGQHGYLGLQRPPWLDPFGDAEVKAMGFLAPILLRVVALGRALRADAMPQGLARRALDALEMGVLVLDAEARVLEANRAAEALLADPGTGLSRAPLGGLRAAPPVMLALRRLVAAAALPGTAAMPGHVVVPPASPEAPRLLAAILPPPEDDSHGIDPRGAAKGMGSADAGGAALVFLRALDGPVGSAAHAAALFGLTPAETRLAEGLTRGQSLAEIAAAQGVRLNTVRTHLARLFDKTGVSRQGQLVALLKAVELPVKVSRRAPD